MRRYSPPPVPGSIHVVLNSSSSGRPRVSVQSVACMGRLKESGIRPTPYLCNTPTNRALPKINLKAIKTPFSSRSSTPSSKHHSRLVSLPHPASFALYVSYDSRAPKPVEYHKYTLARQLGQTRLLPTRQKYQMCIDACIHVFVDDDADATKNS